MKKAKSSFGAFGWTLGLAVVIAALIAFTVFDTNRAEKNEKQKEKDQLVMRLKSDEIRKIELVGRGQPAVELEKTDNQWALKKPIEDLADNQEITNFLFALSQEKTLETVVEGAETNLKTYGLDAPPIRVKLTTAAGQSEEVKIGAVKAYDSSLYAQIDNENRVILVPATWDVMLSKTVNQLRDKHLYRLQGKPADLEGSLERIEVVQTATQKAPNEPSQSPTEEPAKVGFSKTASKPEWQVTGLPSGYPLEMEKVTDYIERLKDLRAQDFHADDKAAPGVLAKFHLDHPALTAKFYSKAKKEPFYELDFSAPGDGGDVYAVSTDLKPVASVFKIQAAQVFIHGDEFFDKKLPFTFKPEDVQRVKVAGSSLKSEFVKKGETWEVAGSSSPGKADGDKVKALLDKLSHLEALRVLQPVAGTQFKADATIETIEIAGVDNKLLLKLEFGPERIEKASAQKPEAKLLLVRSSRVDRILGIPELGFRSLNLGDLIQAPTASKK